jgi:queuine tRNA-ribosyltransferase
LHTPHGTIATPVFMPVGTRGTVKGVTPRELAGDLDVRILLANTYHLYLRPGHDLIRSMGGLHRFMSWDRAILTDSGGYQVFSLDTLRRISDEGVLFRSHLDGDAHMFTPASTVDAQLAFASDIAMVLDECPAYPVSQESARQSMVRTIRWAREAFEHYRRRAAESDIRTALFPIVQGSMFTSLRRECAGELVELGAEGYAVGGLSVGEPRPLSLEIAEATVTVLPRDRPRYVMGVGLPEELPEYVALGVDMMDCVLPSRNARNGCLFTNEGRLIIKHARYRDDKRPPDEDCACYTCRNFSRGYLRHLYQAGEMLYAILATLHNLRRYLDMMQRIRNTIILGTFPELLTAVRSSTIKPDKQ